MVGRCILYISYWNSPFLGDMLVFQGVWTSFFGVPDCQILQCILSKESLFCSTKSTSLRVLIGGCSPPKHVIKNYFTSSDPHHDMLGGGCQVRVVIENMMGRMENLRTLISGFLGLVILVRWALVTIFLSWTTQTGCRIHRTYVSLIVPDRVRWG